MRDNSERDMELSSKVKAAEMRREDRIHMARSAFGKGDGKLHGEEKISGGSGHLFRLITAGILFAVLAVLCYFDVSFHGYDRQWLEQCLQDDHLWEQMTDAVAECVNRLR